MKPLRLILACLLALAGALMLGVSPGLTRTIVSTAKASWTDGVRLYSTVSNTVDFEVIAPPVSIDTFVLAPDGQATSLLEPQCRVGDGLSVGTGGERPSTVATLIPSSTVQAGETLYFRIFAPSANASSAVPDQLIATIVAPTGDREELIVFETGPDTGVFIGYVQTSASFAGPDQGDCVLSAGPTQRVDVSAALPDGASAVARASVTVMPVRNGVIFDSENGVPVSGVKVTLVEAASGQPARVLADDGVTAWPATVLSGQAVADEAGRLYPVQPGEYRFPVVSAGQYRLKIEAPPGFTAPSAASSQQIALLRRPDGSAFRISSVSFGEVFSLSSPGPVQNDVPVDPAHLSLTLTKTASREVALPGDAVFYTVAVGNPDGSHDKRGVTLTDKSAALLRIKPDTIRVDGAPAPEQVSFSPDGHGFTLALGAIPKGAVRIVTYAMTVRADAPAGSVMNEAVIADDRGRSARAGVAVRILREDLASRMTLIGRVTAGGCSADGAGKGLAGVRVVMEDGSFAITDADGRYHFAGLVPGTHVVQAVADTLPPDSRLVDCARSTRSAGSARTRFVMGQGGSLAVADFHAIVPEVQAPQQKESLPLRAESTAAVAERAAAGADTDWLAAGDGPPDFLFPSIDHNPRAPAIRVVIRHRADQHVELKANGRAVDPVTFDGTRQAPGGRFAISTWRGVPLDRATTRLTATVLGPKGKVAAELSRDVHFSQAPARIELVRDKSRLIADGRTRPVLALRLSDRKGRPVRMGLTGEFQLSAPYESAEAIDGMQQRALSGQSRALPRWHVRGDDGMAYVELAPTMTSGKLVASFILQEGEVRRRVEVEAWISPGQQGWTVVGLAEGTAGSVSVAQTMQRSGRFDSPLGEDARIAAYAKGPIAKGVMLTAAYDSARQADDHNLMGAIDPRAYYSVFADMSDRLFDAASRDKLYARIEGGEFYALYGDFEAGFDQSQLASYQRTATGVKAELERGGVHVQGFAAQTASLHRRDEFQGGGISGPYRLSSRAFVPGSETVKIEVRDRFRSGVVLSHRNLTRFVDYDIDLLSGTITFREPVQSRDFALNPQFIVIDYEVEEGSGQGRLNAGLRADVSAAGGKLRLGVSGLTEQAELDGTRKNLTAVDVTASLGSNTELRGEIGTSFDHRSGAVAWLIEAEHHDGKLDLLGYARFAEREFGLNQQSDVERGRRKLGLDLRYRLNDKLSLDASAWRDEVLDDAGHRTALQLGAVWQGKSTDAQLGLAMMRDSLADGRNVQSTVLEGGVSQRLLDNKLELSAASSVALGNSGSIDLPARHRLSARYAVTRDVRLVGAYELARGDAIEARTAQAGVEIAPWSGGRMTGMLGRQIGDDQSQRSFAAFGLSQSLPVTPSLTLTATFDNNRTLSALDPARVVNPDHPVASGGHLGENRSMGEDFTALSLGAAWRSGLWSATLRGEMRAGESAHRKGMTLGALRQLGDGSMIGAGFSWTKAKSPAGAATEVLDGAVALAHRPAASDLALLAKLELRADRVVGAVAGEFSPTGRSALTISGNGQSSRLIASLSGNWTPRSRDGSGEIQRHELGFFTAVRHNFAQLQGFDLAGTTLIGGLDLRYGLGPRFDLGLTGTVRASLADKTTAYSLGPQIGFTPTKDVVVTAGYNFTGFHDPDFAAARTTMKGPFIALRMKFDQGILNWMALGQR